MMLWLAFLILIAVTEAILLWPLMSRRAPRAAILAIIGVLPAGAVFLYFCLGAPALTN